MAEVRGRTTIRMGSVEYNIDITFFVQMQKFEIIIPLVTEQDFTIVDYLFARRFERIVIVDENGQEFTAFDCVCVRKVISVVEIRIVGQYRTLIKGRKIPERGILTFHFEGMEYFFGKFSELIETKRVKSETAWNILKEEHKIFLYTYVNNIKNINDILSQLIKVREYFEFLIDREILVDHIEYLDEMGTQIEVLNDNLLISKNTCLFNKMSMKKTEEILAGLNQWLLQYELYKEVIQIWRKTIYHRNVSVEDIFIWRCQAFELLSTLYEPLWKEAKMYIKSRTRKDPNLRDFLEALNNKSPFIKCKKSYFEEVKQVRNVYTHYNPKKHITEREWYNASHLIEVALNVAVKYVFGLESKENDFLILQSDGNETIRR